MTFRTYFIFCLYYINVVFIFKLLVFRYRIYLNLFCFYCINLN
uniref:Uncharacterized protein n=1 Tax=Meloidogyne enterolobii TaxID=390850 RepID=A0A6V7VEC1_MELEN|nr:unnamed protein product [Meloidogyne enterolobii]